MKKPASHNAFLLAPRSLLLSLAVGALLPLGGVAQAQGVAGDAAAGGRKAAMCTGCHSIPGYQASFPEVHKVPMIAGQNAKYIVAALNGYKKAERKHPTMRGIAASLSDQDMADLAAYYETLPKDVTPAPATLDPQPGERVAALLKKANCQSCHGENLSKPIDASYPKLAGQHPDYLFVALKEYQTRNNAQVGRSNAIMSGMAAPFTHAELKELANYIGSLPGELRTVSQPRFR